MNTTTKQLLVAAAIASMVGIHTSSTSAFAKAKKKGGVKCEGGNACKGKGACKADPNTCKAHSNACKGKGFTMAKNEAMCDKMKTKNAPAAETAPPAEAAPPAGAPPAGEAPKGQ